MLAVACFDIDQERRVVDLIAVGEDLFVYVYVYARVYACVLYARLQSRASILIKKC